MGHRISFVSGKFVGEPWMPPFIDIIDGDSRIESENAFDRVSGMPGFLVPSFSQLPSTLLQITDRHGKQSNPVSDF